MHSLNIRMCQLIYVGVPAWAGVEVAGKLAAEGCEQIQTQVILRRAATHDAETFDVPDSLEAVRR